MKKELRSLILYRLERANETLEEAEILLKQGHANTYINRLYYACFYAVSALLLTKGLSSAKHNGIRSLFHQNFVKTNIVDTTFGQLYDKLFDNRQKADYADFVSFNLNDVLPWYTDTQKFVKTIENITKNAMNISNNIH